MTAAQLQQPADGSLAAILNAIKECDALTPAEKETAFRFSGDSEQVHVYTERASVMRDLLRHPEFELTELRVCGAGCEHPPFGRRVAATTDVNGSVTGVKGKLPIGNLSITTVGRKHNYASAVVSDAVTANDPRDSNNGGSES